jgi:methyl-accepting chemotaxis protein
MSIRQKIMLAISAAVVISLAGVAVTVSIQMRSAFVNNFQVSSEAQLGRMESFVDLFFDNAMATADLVAHSDFIAGGLPHATSYAGGTEPVKTVGAELIGPEKDLYLYFLSLTEYYPAYYLAYVGSKEGGFVQAPDDTLSAGYNPPDRGWYIDAVKAGRALVTEAYISDNGDTVCTVAAPVPSASGRGYDGVVGFDISLAALTKATASVPVGKTGYVLMLDNIGQVVSDPKNSGPEIPEDKRWLGKTLDDLPADASSALKALVKLGRGVSENVRFNDRDWLAGVRLTQSGWALVMLQERDEVFADAMGVTWGIMAVGLGIMALMVFLAWVVGRSMSKPLAVLAGAAHKVAEGDLTAIPQDPSMFRGEIGLLHSSLLRMVSELGALIETARGKMKEAEEALALSKESLAEAEEAKKEADRARRQGVLDTAARIGEIIAGFSNSVRSLADEASETESRAEKQLALVSGVLSAISEMNVVVGEVAAGTSRTAALAGEARERAKTGRKLVLDVVDNMGRIEEQSLGMRAGLEDLGEKAGGIGGVISVINDIADQTNLLALNAAIEAARAGDAGRGFAVVADEVRKLAEKTVEATKQVSASISSMQESTRHSVAAIQESAAFIGSSAEVAHRAGEALDEIANMVGNTAEEVSSIATASEEQAAGTGELNRSAGEIGEITRDVASGAQQSNRAVQSLMEISASLEDIVRKLREE